MIFLNLPGGVTGQYDLTDIQWPLEETKVGDKFYFYPERFDPDGSCPELKEAMYKITSILFDEEECSFTFILANSD